MKESDSSPVVSLSFSLSGARGVMGRRKASERVFLPFPFPSPPTFDAKTTGDESVKELQIGLFLIVYDRYQLMTDCWKEEPKARPSFYQLIEKLEIIMQKDAPYLDVNKHDEAHPYYNVPPNME